jgi:hypothetical protein
MCGGESESGERLPAGVYFCRIDAGRFEAAGKSTLITDQFSPLPCATPFVENLAWL